MTATLFFVTNIVVLYDTYNREPQKWFCVIIQISRISKSGVFKGGISPSGLSPLALYADYPFIIRSYAIYKRQGKAPDGTSCLFDWHERLQRPAFGGHIVWMGGTGCFSASYLLWFCNRIWSIGIPGGIYGRGVLSGGISGAELRSAECAVTVFDFAGVAVAVFSAGLQLSYGAVAAIGLETERLRKVGKKRKEREEEEQEKEKKKGYETFMLSSAIQLYTMPIQLYHYFTFPMWGIFLNLIVIPLLTYAAGSGLLALGIYSIAFVGGKMGEMGGGSSIAGVLSAFGGAASGISEIPEIFRIAASACTGPGHYIFQLYEWLCIQVERVPFHSIVAGRPEMWKIGVFYVALGIRYVWSVGEARENLGRKGIFRFPKDWNAQGKNSVFIAVAVVFLVVKPVHGFQSWFLDVGQGDGVFLRTRDEAILSDCGSSQDKKIGKNVLGPFLKSQGIRTLDWILVSHADADHTNGIEWLLKEEADIRVRNLALPAAGKGQEAYKKLETLARKRGAEVYYLHRGETVRAKSLALRCLYPEAGEKPVEERNSHSLVFDVTYGKFRMLLTGDIGVEEERDILGMEEDKKGEKVTLLKAAHHGSNGSSSEEFLECFSPAFTVLSYGEGNTYGHPAPEAVERLEQTGTEIWRTADSGAVNVWTDGKRKYIKGYKKQDYGKERDKNR